MSVKTILYWIEKGLLSLMMVSSAFGWFMAGCAAVYHFMGPDMIHIGSMMAMLFAGMLITCANVRLMTDVQYRELEIEADEYEEELERRKNNPNWQEEDELAEHLAERVEKGG